MMNLPRKSVNKSFLKFLNTEGVQDNPSVYVMACGRAKGSLPLVAFSNANEIVRAP